MYTHLPCPFSVISLIKLVYNTCKTISNVRYYVYQREGNGPAGAGTPRSPAHRKVGTVDKQQSTAHAAHASTEEHDETVEAHYASLERLRPHACIDGWVFVGYIDDDSEEREASYICRCCNSDEAR